MELRFDAFCQLLDSLGLGQAGCALDQHMAVSEQRDQQAVDQLFLTEDLG